MLRIRLIFSILLAANTLARADINFTPKTSTRELNGIHFPQLEFRDGDKTVTCECPLGWACSGGSASQITFYPPNATQADGSIAETPAIKPFDLSSPEGLKQLRAIALSAVPKNAEKVEVIGEEPNPLK